MKTPYCVIDGVKHQLYLDTHGVPRFSNDGRPQRDSNRMVIDYANGKLPLAEMLDYDTHTGLSYNYVYGVYARNGMNNHIVTQGPEPTRRFRFYPGRHPYRHPHSPPLPSTETGCNT